MPYHFHILAVQDNVFPLTCACGPATTNFTCAIPLFWPNFGRFTPIFPFPPGPAGARGRHPHCRPSCRPSEGQESGRDPWISALWAGIGGAIPLFGRISPPREGLSTGKGVRPSLSHTRKYLSFTEIREKGAEENPRELPRASRAGLPGYHGQHLHHRDVM